MIELKSKVAKTELRVLVAREIQGGGARGRESATRTRTRWERRTLAQYANRLFLGFFWFFYKEKQLSTNISLTFFADIFNHFTLNGHDPYDMIHSLRATHLFF